MITATIKDIEMKFVTSEKVFSPRYIDKGTLAMLSVVEFNDGDKVLDLGCGYGVIGVLAAKLLRPEAVTMVDNDQEAVRLAKENALLNGADGAADGAAHGIRIVLSDGFNSLDDTDFSLILSNPPYHQDFGTPKMFIEKGFNRLRIDGRMFMVTKRKTWYRNKFISIFGGVRIWEIDGYYVFMAEKKASTYSSVGSKTIRKSGKHKGKIRKEGAKNGQ